MRILDEWKHLRDVYVKFINSNYQRDIVSSDDNELIEKNLMKY